jgi:hypothetical protein
MCQRPAEGWGRGQSRGIMHGACTSGYGVHALRNQGLRFDFGFLGFTGSAHMERRASSGVKSPTSQSCALRLGARAGLRTFGLLLIWILAPGGFEVTWLAGRQLHTIG